MVVIYCSLHGKTVISNVDMNTYFVAKYKNYSESLVKTMTLSLVKLLLKVLIKMDREEGCLWKKNNIKWYFINY